jgi:hypothetical protein
MVSITPSGELIINTRTTSRVSSPASEFGRTDAPESCKNSWAMIFYPDFLVFLKKAKNLATPLA